MHPREFGECDGVWIANVELCRGCDPSSAPEVGEEQLGGKDQAWKLQGARAWSMPFLEKKSRKDFTSFHRSRKDLSHPCDAPALSPPSLDHLDSPSHSHCST